MGSILTRIGTWIAGLFADKIIKLIKSMIEDAVRDWKQSKIDAENRKKLEEALNNGDDDDIKKKSEDLLNGNG